MPDTVTKSQNFPNRWQCGWCCMLAFTQCGRNAESNSGVLLRPVSIFILYKTQYWLTRTTCQALKGMQTAPKTRTVRGMWMFAGLHCYVSVGFPPKNGSNYLKFVNFLWKTYVPIKILFRSWWKECPCTCKRTGERMTRKLAFVH